MVHKLGEINNLSPIIMGLDDQLKTKMIRNE